MKFGQLIGCNMINIFLEKHTESGAEKIKIAHVSGSAGSVV